jgi:hypothetical protein
MMESHRIIYPARRRRLIPAIAIVAILSAMSYGAWWMSTHFFTRNHTESSLHRVWAADGSLARLKTWTEPRLGHKDFGEIRFAELPKITGPVGINGVEPLRNTSGIYVAVAFEFGGADNHHGIIIGTDSPEVLAHAPWPVRKQWEPGVWWYDEIPRQDLRSRHSDVYAQ